jgi:hypothetical protein
LKADTHIHSDLSDGAYSIESLAEAAVKHGCDVVAFTDHADRDRDGASDQYFAALRRVNARFPQLIVLPGLEWNIPPHAGDEHVSVLLEPNDRQQAILAEFKDRYDDLYRYASPFDLAVDAVHWLEAQAKAAGAQAVLIYNHPGRKRKSLDSFEAEFRKLHEASPLWAGFEGAPGHQAGDPIGAYERDIQLDGRWDPSTSRGGVWDRYLQEGRNVFAAAATSDFHSNRSVKGVNDYLPGEFSETWIYARDRSARSALEALQAGSFFGVHGHIARRVQLMVNVPGLNRPAYTGEVIQAPVGATCQVEISSEVPEKDWHGEANRLDSLELIAITRDEVKTLTTVENPKQPVALTCKLDVPRGGVALRAVGRRHVPERPELAFVTNPVRVQADN